MTELFNQLWSRDRRRELRGRMPRAEALLWQHLRGRGMHGHKFRRQFGIGPYIADFYCARLRVAIEADGDSHVAEDAKENDAQRDAYFTGLGIRVMRFTNDRIMHDLEAVLEEIAAATLPPLLTKEGEGEV